MHFGGDGNEDNPAGEVGADRSEGKEAPIVETGGISSKGATDEPLAVI